MVLDSDRDRDMPAVTMEPHFNTQQKTDISDVGVTRTRDPMAQVSTDLLSSSGTRTDDMPGARWSMLINTTVHTSPLAIDWTSLGQSEFDLPGTFVSASGRPTRYTTSHQP